jgi:hypothetical protein
LQGALCALRLQGTARQPAFQHAGVICLPGSRGCARSPTTATVLSDWVRSFSLFPVPRLRPRMQRFGYPFFGSFMPPRALRLPLPRHPTSSR